AKLGQRIGWVLIFRMVLVVFAASSVLMISSRTVAWVITGQLLAGAAAAIIVPALVALIAENYRGAQQAAAVGSLGSARAFSGMSAFLIGGTLGTFRSEEHTSELQSRFDLVCRLLLEKKKEADRKAGTHPVT